MSELEEKLKMFDYGLVDQDTENFLKAKVYNIKNIVNKAYTETGKELKEAQDKLSKSGNGCFQEWYESLGFKKNNVYDLIKRYEFIVLNEDNLKTIESLPIKLSKEISKPSTPQELVKATLAGDITTHKQFQEMLSKMKGLENENSILKNVKPTIIEKEIVPPDYESTKQKNKILEADLKNQNLNLISLKSIVDNNAKSEDEIEELNSLKIRLQKDCGNIKDEIDRLSSNVRDDKKYLKKVEEITSYMKFIQDEHIKYLTNLSSFDMEGCDFKEILSKNLQITFQELTNVLYNGLNLLVSKFGTTINSKEIIIKED